ncbi:MAG: zinc ribbon domain-containing protein [Burkholderiales bacterium]|nr:zinc ribbon domain-containing protein [Burkholderiales bacterium]
MKCSFCGSENPAHANYCMNCGSPQDLAGCPQCGALNRKNAATCQKCAASLSASALQASTPTAGSLQGCAKEAEALAKEARKFKELFDELEQDVKRRIPQRRDDPGPVSFTPTATGDSDVVAVSISPTVRKPAVMYASDGTGGTTGARSAHKVVLLALLLLGALACYAVFARNAATSSLRPVAIIQPGVGVESAGQSSSLSAPAVASPADGARPRLP